MLSNFTAELYHANLSKINLCDNIINPFNHQKYVAATLQKYVAATQQKYVAATLQKIWNFLRYFSPIRVQIVL